MGGPNLQRPLLAVRFEIDSSDEIPIEEIREHVVSVDSFFGWHVYLHAISEPEEPLSAPPLPDERVERAQQRGADDSPRTLRLRMQVHRAAPAVDLYFLEKTVGRQAAQNRPCSRDVQPVVVREIAWRPHTMMLSREQQELSLRLGRGHRRDVEVFGGQHALREVVDPPECGVPVGRDATFGE